MTVKPVVLWKTVMYRKRKTVPFVLLLFFFDPGVFDATNVKPLRKRKCLPLRPRPAHVLACGPRQIRTVMTAWGEKKKDLRKKHVRDITQTPPAHGRGIFCFNYYIAPPSKSITGTDLYAAEELITALLLSPNRTPSARGGFSSCPFFFLLFRFGPLFVVYPASWRRGDKLLSLVSGGVRSLCALYTPGGKVIKAYRIVRRCCLSSRWRSEDAPGGSHPIFTSFFTSPLFLLFYFGVLFGEA